MKQNGTLWNSPRNGVLTDVLVEKEPYLNGFAGKDMKEVDGLGSLTIDEIGDEHISTSYDTPLREDAFDLSDTDKMDIIEGHFREIMLTLGLDLKDDSLKGTPRRVAKMYVQEIFSGLNPANMPKIALFDNKYRYNEMLVEKNITFYSNCEHHFVPIIGKAHVAYISNGKVIGLSKINRIVQYFAKRPQVQERLTVQIGNYLKKVLETEDIAVVIDATHMCVSSRGIQDQSSSTVTSFFGGVFKSDAKRQEFFRQVEMK
jgi:GTP cyclohydrolase I